MERKTIALTGAMGSGKSLASSLFLKHGAKVISADALAKRVLAEDAAARPQLAALLGAECFADDGAPIIKKIAGKVFADAELLKEFEAIIHPRTRELWEREAENAEGLTLVEIPLLFEKKLENRFEICATVYCSEAIRIKRLAHRGLSLSEISERDAFQMSAAEKMSKADIVFFNDGSTRFLEDQIKIFVNNLYGRRE